MEVRNIIQEVVINAIPKKKKCNSTKWLSEKALQIAETREAKGKREKERYTHLNAEFQRIPWRDKKAFLGDQCKEIEENNRMGKTRDLFKKIRDAKGTFLSKMGSIKDRNGMDLTKQKILRRGSKNTKSSVQFSCSVMSDSFRPHELQHARLPYPSPTPGMYSNSCPLSRWCHPTISSSVVPFSSCLQSFPASGSFPMS